MKKELFAAVLLVIICALSIINAKTLGSLTEEVASLVDSSVERARCGDWEHAARDAERALAVWRARNPYTHAILRHSDIDALEDSYFRFLSAVHSRRAADAFVTARAVEENLEDIANMERIRLGSIF